MKSAVVILFVFLLISCNPFAPGLDDSSDGISGVLSDQKTIDGVFQNFRYAYTFRDTTIYGQLLDGNFTFFYIDYDNGGVPVTWGRDEEMRTAHGLFQNVQRLSLVWNEIVAAAVIDSTNEMITRSFTLKVMFNPSDNVDIEGKAVFTMKRQQPEVLG